ncbi:hsp90 co-chaperone Cdc37-like [Toxorhynchites rutilus septentrionalis]|uniref:hsp90 co-chaperone Cdc37-like n=1 Tax=Toxorhynchites rutilus septentrionalis TaxID=329112 RepID=UPI002479F741|nr:hsp90 co-chaperone Cdc37-like [Toxorhynchites rutilus septentrionalis]
MVDYSKWKNIEISDDEDDTHPNIDTPSLFRWRHQARVERMEEQKREKEQMDAKKRAAEQKMKEIKQKLDKKDSNLEELKKSLEELEMEQERVREEEEMLLKKEQMQPWNVDTISKDGFKKTPINKSAINKKVELTEDQKELNLKEFIKKYEKELKHYGMMRNYDDSKKYLRDNHKLVCEDAANYLVIWCIELEKQEKQEMMAHVAHQCICMQYILDISKQLDVDPRACVELFFQRIQIAETEYKNQFLAVIEAFKERIRKRAQERLQKAIEEQEEEERKAQLGPGGLDSVEVFESLLELPEDEARVHLQRCIDSGLWVPDANKAAKTDATADKNSNPIYVTVPSEEKQDEANEK